MKNGVTDLAEYNLDPAKADVLRIDVTRGADGKPTSTRAPSSAPARRSARSRTTPPSTPTPRRRTSSRCRPPASSRSSSGSRTPAAFRGKNLLALESFRQPDAILVKNSYGELEFFRTDEKDAWQLYRGTTAHKVDPTEVRKLIDELNKKGVVVSFPDPKGKELVEKPHATVRVYADSLEKSDAKKPGKPVLKKDAKLAAELRFGLPEGNDVAVDRIWGADSTSSWCRRVSTPRSGRGRWPTSTGDPALQSGHAEENVTRVELTREGKTSVVARSGATGPWKIDEPMPTRAAPPTPRRSAASSATSTA